MEQKFLRNKDLIPQSKLDDVTVVGLGGIGSGVVMLLATMGFKFIRGYDNDIMQEHNFSTTLYPESWYDKEGSNTKASMAERTAKNYGGKMIETEMNSSLFTGEGQVLSPKTIVCTDSMTSRKLVYESWLMNPDREILIDLRMDALSMSCITTTQNLDKYQDYWFPNGGSGEQTPCTMKHTIFCANLISGIGVNQLFNYLTQRPFYAYIWQGLSPLVTKTEDFNCGEVNESINITEGEAYANTNSYSLN